MSSKSGSNQRGILENPPETEIDYFRNINYPKQGSLVPSFENFKGQTSPQISGEAEGNELNYQFPRKRIFNDNGESLWSNRVSDARLRTHENGESHLRVSRQDSGNTGKNKENEEGEELNTQTGEIRSETRLDLHEDSQTRSEERNSIIYQDLKKEMNKEIDILRKALEQQIETIKVLENQKTNKKLERLKSSFEDVYQKLIVDLASLQSSQEHMQKFCVNSRYLKNLEKIPEIEDNLSNLYSLFSDIQEKELKENRIKDPLSGVVPVIEAFMFSYKEQLNLRLQEIEKKLENLEKIKEKKEKTPFIRTQNLNNCIKIRKQSYYNPSFPVLCYQEFISIVEDYLNRIPRWHRENLIRSLGEVDIHNENNPFWMDYLRNNFANGENVFINSDKWYWVPFDGSIKEKIKYYVLCWEFIECETLNFVRHEIGFDQILVLGGGMFPYKITYLKYKCETIPSWWNDLIQELQDEGLKLVPKIKDSCDLYSWRILQISRQKYRR